MPQDIPSLLVSFAEWLFETDLFIPEKIEKHPRKLPLGALDRGLRKEKPTN